MSFDIVCIALAFADYFVIKATLQSFVYTLKLELKFIMLNQFLGIVKHNIAPRGIYHPDQEEVKRQPPCKFAHSLCDGFL